MKHGWTGDRAVGFTVGLGVSFFFAVGLMSKSPLPFFLALALIAVGIVVPSIEQNNERT